MYAHIYEHLTFVIKYFMAILYATDYTYIIITHIVILFKTLFIDT